MAIRFRCEHCNQLMSIASRQSGASVPCPACGREVTVPAEDQPDLPVEGQLSRPSAIGPASETPEEASTGLRRADRPLGATEAESEKPAAEESASQVASRADSPQERAALVSSTGPGRDEQPVAGLGDRDFEEALEADDERGFELRGVKTEFGEMDLTPMVDVTFLLLIFFMVTASFSLQKSIEIPSPDPDQEGAAQSIQNPEDLEENSIIVRIDENNAITVDFEPVADPENLADLLADRRRSQQKSELAIDADARARHGTVVLVNDAAVEAEFQRIRLLVRNSDGGESAGR